MTTKKRRRYGAVSSSRPIGLFEKLKRVQQGLEHTPYKGNADETPGKDELHRGSSSMIVVFHDDYLLFQPATGESAPSSAFMWWRWSTALTKKLQMNPITNRPAMIYMVVL